MKVSELMNPSVVTVSQDESVALAARLLSRNNVGSLPVRGPGGELRGMVTDRDIVLRCVAADAAPERTSVGEIMTRSVVTVSPGDDIQRASQLMGLAQVRRLPVTENGKLVGILSLGDMARVDVCDTETSRALTEISTNIKDR